MTRAREHLFVGGAVALALACRLAAITWGLPLAHAHIDESVVVFYAMRVLAGAMDPAAFFDYPSLFLYWLAVVFRAAAWLRGLSVEEAVRAHMSGSPELFFVAGRLLSAALGAVSVWLLHRLARRVGGRRPAAAFVPALAALLLAVDRLNVLHGHYATVDVAAVCFSLAALDMIARYWSAPSPAAGAWAGACVGLAAALKYYPALLAAPLLAAPWALGLKRPFRAAAVPAAAAAAAFFAGHPFALLAPARFFERGAHLFSNIVAPGGAASWPLLPTLRHLLANAGPAALLCAGGGLYALCRERDRPALIYGSAAGLVILFFGFWGVQSEHYALLVYPILFLFAAEGAFRLKAFHPALPAAAGTALLLLAAAPSWRQWRVLARPDTRLAALAWIRENVPAGSRVLRFAHTPEFTPRDPFAVKVDWENARLAAGAAPDLAGFDYVLLGSFDPERDGQVRALSGALGLVRTFEDPARRFPHHPTVYIFRGGPRD